MTKLAFKDNRIAAVYCRMAGVTFPVDSTVVPFSYLVHMYPDKIAESFTLANLYDPLRNMDRIMNGVRRDSAGEIRKPAGYEDAVQAYLTFFFAMAKVSDEINVIFNLYQSSSSSPRLSLFSDDPDVQDEEQLTHRRLSYHFGLSGNEREEYIPDSVSTYIELKQSHMQGLYVAYASAPYLSDSINNGFWRDVVGNWLAVAVPCAELLEAARQLPEAVIPKMKWNTELERTEYVDAL